MELDLPTQTDRRLRAAGITADDPGLAFICGWNAAVYARAEADPERAAHIAMAKQWQLEREQKGQTDGP